MCEDCDRMEWMVRRLDEVLPDEAREDLRQVMETAAAIVFPAVMEQLSRPSLIERLIKERAARR